MKSRASRDRGGQFGGAGADLAPAPHRSREPAVALPARDRAASVAPLPGCGPPRAGCGRPSASSRSRNRASSTAPRRRCDRAAPGPRRSSGTPRDRAERAPRPVPPLAHVPGRTARRHETGAVSFTLGADGDAHDPSNFLWAVAMTPALRLPVIVGALTTTVAAERWYASCSPIDAHRVFNELASGFVRRKRTFDRARGMPWLRRAKTVG